MVSRTDFFVSTEPDGAESGESAVTRSLGLRPPGAENRVDRFLDVVVELLNQGSGKGFRSTVVERSGEVDPRSFYQYFSGKHDFQLAIFEESVRSTTDSPPA